MNRMLSLILVAAGLAGLALATFAMTVEAESVAVTRRAYVTDVIRAPVPPKPTPIPPPPPYAGPISSIYLGSANILGQEALVEGDTHYVGERELLQDPFHPLDVMWYPRFGRPGWGGGNTIFAAHVNYIGYGNGPFAYLTAARPGDALYLTMGDGSTLTYIVRSVDIVSLVDLNMNDVVYPPLDGATERVTLISCGGTFIPAAVGGEYDSRVILVAERTVP